MSSPFPGMDPFIEGQVWEDFHQEYIGAIRSALVRHLPPRYVPLLEQRVYIDRNEEENQDQIIADVGIAGERLGDRELKEQTATIGQPVLLEYPLPEERRETYLTIRTDASREIVTVIEVLSPANKRQGSECRAQ
jgi:hypothetical protein